MTIKALDTRKLNVSRETQQRLEHFVQLFMKWAKVINLVAPSTMDDVWRRHIIDSVQLYELASGPYRWIDLGSGGGFPGVITAIRLAETGGGWVHLVESNHKKAGFLRVALQETGARGSVHPVRIEDAPKDIDTCDFVSARALADVDRLLGYSEVWFKHNPSCRAFFHKGREYREELRQAHGSWGFDLIEHQSVVEADSKILEISNLRRQ